MPRAAFPITLALLLVAPGVPARDRKSEAKPDPALDLTGTYTIAEAALPDGTSYSGELAIERMSSQYTEELWSLERRVAGRDEPLRGVGTVIEGFFFVAYGTGDDYGLSVFLPIAEGDWKEWMQGEDNVQGMWFNAAGAFGQEGLRGSVDPYQGSYRVHGHTKVGERPSGFYDGTLEVTPEGEVLRLAWKWKYADGTESEVSGIGMEVPGLLLGAWGPAGDSAVGAYTIESDRLRGLVASTGGVSNETLLMPERVAPPASAPGRRKAKRD